MDDTWYLRSHMAKSQIHQEIVMATKLKRMNLGN